MTTSFHHGESRPDPAVSTLDDTAPPGGGPGPRSGFLFGLGFAAIGTAMANLVPLVLTLSIKATEIDPRGATTVVSIVASVGALCSLIAFPVFGRLSDRATGRLGRRRPFLLLGAVLFAAGAAGMLTATGTATLTAAGVVTAIGFSSATVALTAVIPDQLAPDRRGPASAIVGLSLPLGAVAGLFVAQLVSPNLPAMILLPAGIGVAGCLLFSLTLRDPRLPADRRPPSAGRTSSAPSG
ncbi:MFS transporter [Thermocatellispora tengchongensis]|uniref:MFS transporter n=1 Tax=Thermocatellispora tengchongensis TaxID=1073253 RepID=UPI00363E3B17